MFRILSLFCIMGFSQQINAQCCSAGNPSSAGSSGNMAKNYLSVSSSYVHSYSDTYYMGDAIYDGVTWFSHLENSRFDFGLLNLSYGINNKLSISTELGYFINKSMDYTYIDATRKAYGLGDAAIDLRYQVANLKKHLASITASIKTTIPVGEFDQMDRNVILPIDIQPSSGSFKTKTALSFSKRFYGSKFSVSSYISSEFSQLINTERTYYKYGNLYTLNLSTAHKTSKKVTTGLALNYVLRNKALTRNLDLKEELIESTGGTFINVQPRVTYQLPEGFGLSTSINFPIYRKVNGIQLTNKYLVFVGISKGFALKRIKPILSDILLQSYNENTFFVDGICGMCKTRIEDLTYSVNGVKWAEWNLESKQLSVKFEDEINSEKLAKSLSKGGHDNWMFTAKDKAYNNLHSCCKYRIGD